MITVRPLDPVRVARDPDTSIAYFTDVEWQSLIELVSQYWYEPDNPQEYNQPVELDARASQELWGAISAVYKDDEVASNAILKARVEKLMRCAQIGAEHGGIEIRREPEFS
jgi:hypothetical protein